MRAISNIYLGNGYGTDRVSTNYQPMIATIRMTVGDLPVCRTAKGLPLPQEKLEAGMVQWRRLLDYRDTRIDLPSCLSANTGWWLRRV